MRHIILAVSSSEAPIFVVALDDSECSEKVVQKAVSFASMNQASLLFVHVIGLPISTVDTLQLLSPNEVRSALMHKSKEKLEKLISQYVPATMHSEIFITEGVAAEVIPQIAQEHHAMMVICGAHSYSRLERVLGTTASRIVNNTPCCVLIVR